LKVHTPQNQRAELPLGLKVVACYFIVIGTTSLLLGLFVSGPRYSELATRSVAQKLGAATRTVLLNVGFVSCGIGLFRRRAWAHKLALFILAADTFYSTYGFAWGFSQGKPTSTVLFWSFVIVGGWNMIWCYLLFRRSSAQVSSVNED
jgi:hypothetical protein